MEYKTRAKKEERSREGCSNKEGGGGGLALLGWKGVKQGLKGKKERIELNKERWQLAKMTCSI
jgi:hypothetical protein